MPMARRVYFSFHIQDDLWRVNQIRNQLDVAEVDQVGFFDPAEYEEVMRADKSAIRRLIRQRIAGTSVTLVLIGSQTASRPFAHLELEESLANQNGFLGIHIHGLDDQQGKFSLSGPRPILPPEIEFPCYVWDWDLGRLHEELLAAARRADQWRARALESKGSGH